MNETRPTLHAVTVEPGVSRALEILTTFTISIGAGVLTLLVAASLITGSNNTLSSAEARPLLVVLFFIVSLTTYVTLSAKHRALASKRALITAKLTADAARQAKAAPKIKTWGDILEARLTAFAPIFDEAKVEERAPPLEEPPAPEAMPFQSILLPEAPVKTELETIAPDVMLTNAMPPFDPRNAGIERFALATMVALESAILDVTEVLNFGVRLYVGAACGEVARRNAWPLEQSHMTLAWALEQIGATEDSARAFARNANEFARIDAFRPLIDGGRDAMVSQLDMNADPAGNFWELLLAWQTDNHITLPPDRYTVVIYTMQFDALTASPIDIARSQRAYRLVIEHVLETCGGTVIHALPHGMAIAYGDSEQAVRAAIEIQQQATALTRSPSDPHPTLHVALDIDLGVASSNQFASVALSRAAQIIEMTPPGKIYCTEEIAHILNLSDVAPVPFMETNAALPPLFAINWTPLPETELRNVEYHHIGKATPAPNTALLDEWLEANKAR